MMNGSFELPTAGKYYWEWVTNTVGVTPSLGWTDITNWSPTSTSTGEEIKIVCFPNSFKEKGSNQPDIRIYTSKEGD